MTRPRQRRRCATTRWVVSTNSNLEPFAYDDVNERRTVEEAEREDGPARTALDLNNLTKEQADNLLWKLYRQNFITRSTWVRGTREVRNSDS